MVILSYAVYQKCCICNTGIGNTRNVTRIGEKTIEKTRCFYKNKIINLNDFICGKCRIKINTKSSSTQDLGSYKTLTNELDSLKVNINDNKLDEIAENEEVKERGKKIQLLASYNTSKHCLLCNAKRGLHKIKDESIIFAYKYYGILIGDNSRCCTIQIGME